MTLAGEEGVSILLIEHDMNVVMNEAGQFIELQGTAEGHAFRRDELDTMLALAEKGIREIMQAQQEALHG